MTMAPGLGAEFAGYRIEAILGRGGVGLVYLAEDLNLPRRVALKILRAEYAEDPQFRERFVRESRLAASLDHLNIVPIYKAGEAGGVLYIAMRYVDGTDLRRLLAAEGPLDLDRTIGILAQVGSALDAAHAQGLCHRDVKPANILVTPGSHGMPDQAYLVDFGITKRTSTAGLTQAGQFVGTLDYAAPEQIRGLAIDARTDVYSLGCVLYECLAGIAPFRRTTDLDTMQAHLSAPRPRISAVRPEMGPAMDHVVSTAMAREPDDRYGSAVALVTAVRAARPWSGVDRRSSTRPPSAAPPPPPPPAEPPARRRGRRVPPPAAGVAALVTVGVAGALLLGHRGGDTGAATSTHPTAAPSAAPPPGTLRLEAALLTLSDFAPGSVAPAPSTLQLGQVSCGVPPTGEVEERRVAFTGRGDTAGRAYFNAAASFPADAEARSYLDSLTAAAQGCPQRLPDGPAAPALGDGTVRVLFPSAPGAVSFVFDALYIRRGRVVGLVLVSRDGTTPPPPGDAPAVGRLAAGHMATAGA
jgi:serine/threonine-protein kinase